MPRLKLPLSIRSNFTSASDSKAVASASDPKAKIAREGRETFLGFLGPGLALKSSILTPTRRRELVTLCELEAMAIVK